MIQVYMTIICLRDSHNSSIIQSWFTHVHTVFPWRFATCAVSTRIPVVSRFYLFLALLDPGSPFAKCSKHANAATSWNHSSEEQTSLYIYLYLNDSKWIAIIYIYLFIIYIYNYIYIHRNPAKSGYILIIRNPCIVPWEKKAFFGVSTLKAAAPKVLSQAAAWVQYLQAPICPWPNNHWYRHWIGSRKDYWIVDGQNM